MKEKNLIGEAFDIMKDLWRHRKGQEIPAAVFDTLDMLYRPECKPVVVKSIRQPLGWLFILSLPAGLTYSDFRRHEEAFADATGGAVVVDRQGKAVHLQVLTGKLQSSYPYDWDPSMHSKLFLPVPFGYSAAGLIVRDMAVAPNILIAGHPGSGKSNFLHVLAISLLLSRAIRLCIIDLKRLEFSYLQGQTLLVTEVQQARQLLQAINRQLDSRLTELERAGAVKIQDFAGNMPFLVVIIDELAELQDDECQVLLNRILRLGRAAGVCVAAATQRPSSSLFAKFGDSKAMFACSMCFHVRDGVNSRMVLDNDRAALIPNIPGRAVYQWEQELEVQSMYLPVSQARKLMAGKEAVSDGWGIDLHPKRLLPR